MLNHPHTEGISTMSDDELGGELDRVLRVALTASGQLAERLARSQADAERNAHHATLEAQREAERQLARQVEAGRVVYGGIRDPQIWEQPNSQLRLGEALVTAEALRDVDPVAVPAGQYIRAEARLRHGVDSEAWLATAVQMYLEDLNERADRTPGHDESRPKGADRPGQLAMDPEPAVMQPHRWAEAEAGASTTQPMSLEEAAVAAQAFPRNATDELNGRARSATTPRARKSSDRTRQRDRSR